MAECYINLRKFDEARITLNILTQITRQKEADSIPIQWNSKIQTKLNELIDHVSKVKKGNQEENTKGTKFRFTTQISAVTKKLIYTQKPGSLWLQLLSRPPPLPNLDATKEGF